MKREGITQYNPVGSSWKEVPGELVQVSVWKTQAWGVKKDDKIFYTVLPGGVSEKVMAPTGEGGIKKEYSLNLKLNFNFNLT